MTSATHSDDVPEPWGETDDAGAEESKPQRDMRALLGGTCTDCRDRYSAREAVCSIFLGLKNAPRCLPCTGRRLGRDVAELRASLVSHFARRDCYLRAWREAEQIDGGESEVTTQPCAIGPEAKEGPEPDATWDAGGMACGDLVMALRLRVQTLRPGDVIRVTATDPAAPEDLPAWCRLCGHTLAAMHHPTYWIRRKGG